MDQQEDSFDGTFTDNIKSPAYKNQFSSKKGRVVMNVSGKAWATQRRSTQWLSTWDARTSGICRQSRPQH